MASIVGKEIWCELCGTYRAVRSMTRYGGVGIETYDKLRFRYCGHVVTLTYDKPEQ